MVSHHPVKFDGHRYCVVKMILVVEVQDSTCSCLNLPLLFTSDGLKAHSISTKQVRSW